MEPENPTLRNSLPPKDSWIELKPGAEVVLDERLCREWSKLRCNYREVRGNFLAACFEFEFMIDQLIAEAFFPGADSTDQAASRQLRDCFDDIFMKGGVVQFARKIDALKQIHSRVSRLQAAIRDDVFPKLTKVRKIRNKFAHYPIAFEPRGEPPNQTLAVWLVTCGSRIELNDKFIREYSMVFGEVAKTLESGLKQLKGEVEPIEDVASA